MKSVSSLLHDNDDDFLPCLSLTDAISIYIHFISSTTSTLILAFFLLSLSLSRGRRQEKERNSANQMPASRSHFDESASRERERKTINFLFDINCFMILGACVYLGRFSFVERAIHFSGHARKRAHLSLSVRLIF